MSTKEVTPEAREFIDFVAKTIESSLANHPPGTSEQTKENERGQSEEGDEKVIDGKLRDRLEERWKREQGEAGGDIEERWKAFLEENYRHNRVLDKDKIEVFTAKNRPDFVLKSPHKGRHKVVVEYKKYRDDDKHTAAVTMRVLLGQCIIHAFSGKYDYVLGFYRDATTGGHFYDSMSEKAAQEITKWLETRNIFLTVVHK